MKSPDIFTTHWFLYDKLIGTAETEGMSYAKGQVHVPYSYIRICPTCGEVWSKVIINHPSSQFVPETRKCPRHGAGYLGEYEGHYHMPREAVIHELRVFDPEQSYMTFLITGGR